MATDIPATPTAFPAEGMTPTTQTASLTSGPGAMTPPAPTNPAYGMQDMTKVPVNPFTNQYEGAATPTTSTPAGLPPSVGDPNAPPKKKNAASRMMDALTAPGMLLDPTSPEAGVSRSESSTEHVAPELAAARLLHERGLFDVGTAAGADNAATKGFSKFATGMIRPESLLLLTGGGVFEGIPQVARAGMSAIFGAQMAHQVVQKSPEFVQAVKQQDWDKAVEIASEEIPTAAMAFQSGLHAFREAGGAIHEAGARARESMAAKADAAAAKEAARVAEAKTGKVLTIRPDNRTLAAAPEPDKFAESGGKLVSTSAETPTTIETGAADPIEDLIMSDKIGGKKVRGATPQLPAAPEPEPEAFAEHGGKFVGKSPEAPAPAVEYHPDLQKLAEQNGGLHTSAAKVVSPDEGSFITPDGKFVSIRGTHDIAIGRANPENRPEGILDNRPGFVDDTATIRTRMRTTKAGNTLSVTVPKDGVSSEQVDALQRVVQAMGKNGNLVIERADVTADNKDAASTTKEQVKPYQVEDALREIGAHPDQQDLVSKELQPPHKETFGMQITDPDGTVHVEKVDAYTNNESLKVARKKFPDAAEILRLPEQDEPRVPSTAYEVPTGKLHKMKESMGRPEIDTIRHELGHVFEGAAAGMQQEGMWSSAHPGMPSDARAAIKWSGEGLIGPDGRFKPEKRVAVVQASLGAIAADEVFNDLPRAANHNFNIRAGGDGTKAYNLLRLEGYTHEAAMDRMHQMIDQSVTRLQHPAVASVIHENAGVREAGLSRQFHYSPERLNSMVAEANRRMTDEKYTEKHDTGPDDGQIDKGRRATNARREGGVSETTGREPQEGQITNAEKETNEPNLRNRPTVGQHDEAVAAGRTGDVARGEGEVQAADKGLAPEGEEGIVSEEKIKKAPKEMAPELAQQIVDAHEAAGGSTFNLTHGNLAGTENYSVSTNPERGLTLDHPPTTKDIQDFAAKNQDLLKSPEKSLGTWHNTANDTHTLDVVSTISDRKKAIALGKKNNQIAIYHLGGEGEIPTGGTGVTPFEPSTGGTPEAPAAPPMPKASESLPLVSTRMPSKTVKGKTIEDHTNGALTSDMQAATAAPGYLQKLADRVADTPGFKDPGGDATTRTNAYIRHVADNVKFVWSKLTPEEIKKDEQWYPVGAHERGIEVAKQHAIDPHQAYAGTAALSPLTDWDQNTSQAERAVNIWKNQQGTKFTPEMKQAGREIASIPAMKKFASKFKKLEGKTLGELTDVRDQALWVRLYDEGHNSRDYQTWNPDGTPAGIAKNQDGSPKAMGWSFQNLIEHAIDILKDGSQENISKVLGTGHKVRNFYNNQLAPDDPRFLTIDTHAVNVGQLRPMSGKTPAVKDNFGGISNKLYGLKGTYALHDAGYRLAAKELDIPIPSRLQSPTWVKIREVFPNKFKTPENQQAIDAIWKEHTDGKITTDEARNKIWDYANGWNARNAKGTGTPSDQGELPDVGVYGESARGTAGRGTGSNVAPANQEVTPEEDTSFNFGANVKPAKAASRTSRVSTKQQAKNDAMAKGIAGLIRSGKK